MAKSFYGHIENCRFHFSLKEPQIAHPDFQTIDCDDMAQNVAKCRQHCAGLGRKTSLTENQLLAGLVAELSKALFSGVNAPAALSVLCHWGFDSCASFELERWREFILKAK